MCKMKVIKLDESSELHTLCYDNNGDYEPLTDFMNAHQALLVQQLINDSGFCIKLSEHATTREFSIGKHDTDGVFKLIQTTTDLTSALDFINIKVNFLVEPPPMEIQYETLW